MTANKVTFKGLSGMSFNTASGMRSHVTHECRLEATCFCRFQYRKRYEVTCDNGPQILIFSKTSCFNTASGMRSHVTFRRVFLQWASSVVSIPQAV